MPHSPPPHLSTTPGTSTDILLWLALCRTEGLGPVRLRQLLEVLGTPDGIFQASGAQLEAVQPALPPQVVRSLLKGPDLAWAREQQILSRQHGAAIVPYDSPEYPALLREISSPPPVLFARGPLPLHSTLAVAVVGTRDATPLGLENCRFLTHEWSRRGIRVVSGLARGIDQQAHQSTLDAGGETAAVLGGGLDWEPSGERRLLQERLGREGLLLSELPFGTAPTPYTFPRRNRIISGLCQATVVVEAGVRSGALITARDCLEQGRELLAVPGPPTWESLGGCHELLRQGAALCTCPEDLYHACRWTPRPAGLPDLPEHPITTLLRQEPMSSQSIAHHLSQPLPTLLPTLLDLELTGLVRRLPGGLYACA